MGQNATPQDRRPSTYWWEDDSGTMHTINQGEGGEQGDPLMPQLFAVGQHLALVATQERLEANEWIFANSSTTSTFSPSRREWCCLCSLAGGNCSGMPTFGSMAGKHTSGMTPVLSHPFVKPSSALQRRLIRRHECGVVQTSLHTVKGFVSWVLLWDILISYEHS